MNQQYDKIEVIYLTITCSLEKQEVLNSGFDMSKFCHFSCLGTFIPTECALHS